MAKPEAQRVGSAHPHRAEAAVNCRRSARATDASTERTSVVQSNHNAKKDTARSPRQHRYFTILTIGRHSVNFIPQPLQVLRQSAEELNLYQATIQVYVRRFRYDLTLTPKLNPTPDISQQRQT
jgi:hypothetical protein